MSESVFEVVDVTDEETYFPLGIYPTLEAAIAFVELAGDNPLSLGPTMDYHEEYARVEIRERQFGPGESGKCVWTRKWSEAWSDDGEECEMKIVAELAKGAKE